MAVLATDTYNWLRTSNSMKGPASRGLERSRSTRARPMAAILDYPHESRPSAFGHPAPMAVLQPSRPMSPKGTCWPERLETQMGGNLPFIRPGLNGEVVPKAVLRRLRSGLLRSSPILPSTARTYTAIHTAARGSLMQRLIRVELIIDS